MGGKGGKSGKGSSARKLGSAGGINLAMAVGRRKKVLQRIEHWWSPDQRGCQRGKGEREGKFGEHFVCGNC